MFATPADCLDCAYSSLQSVPPLQNIRQKAIRLNQNPIYLIHTHHLPHHLEWLNLKKTRIVSDGWVGPPLIYLHTLVLDQTHLSDLGLLTIMTPNLRHLSLMDIEYLPTLLGLRDLPLETLILDGTSIQPLTDLPSCLLVLSAQDCGIRLVQSRMPVELRICNLACNRLKNGGVPLKWGGSLQELDLSYNELESFPRCLPNTLRILKLQNNRITHFPKVLPEQLQVLNLVHNRIREVPVKMYTPSLTYCNMEYNCLTRFYGSDSLAWCKLVLSHHNWNHIRHDQTVSRLQKSWRLFRLRKTLRNIYRTSKIRQELLEVAMHPDRAGRFEDRSPEWTY